MIGEYVLRILKKTPRPLMSIYTLLCRLGTSVFMC